MENGGNEMNIIYNDKTDLPVIESNVKKIGLIVVNNVHFVTPIFHKIHIL